MTENVVTTTLHCANHPDRETMLRCNKCNKPICYECAVLTEVGYRCRECVREQQSVYYNAGPLDPMIAMVIAGALGAVFGALAYAFLGILGFLGIIAAIFIGPAVGGVIAEAVRRGVSRRRSRNLKYFAAAACIIGFLVGGMFLFGGAAILSGHLFAMLGRLLPALFFRLDVVIVAVLSASTILARLW
jgi:uncharacterized membrane protein YqgA involved in biofilm formation